MTRKTLSADGMISLLTHRFSTAEDTRGNRIAINLKDALMTAFSAFSLKYPSFNCFFDELDRDENKRISIQNLYNIKTVPSATRLKEIIDPIETSAITPVFLDIYRELQRGKALENFLFMDKYYILALDGTQYFHSKKVSCKKCLIKKSKSGEESFSHQLLAGCIVHPSLKQVIPVAPEPIQNGDGHSKNDCERNGANRFLENFRKEHPKLPVIITEDGLASNAPHIREIKSMDMHFILGAKPGDHTYLFSWVNALHDELQIATRYHYEGKKVIRRITQTIRYINEVPLNDANHDLKVNFLELIETVEKKIENITHDADGIATVTKEWIREKETKFSWVTDLELKENNVFSIMQGGRKRWAIENETFNTLKNQGYNFEHNYGHGNDNLATNFAMLMMLAFLVDQVQDLCCKTFQRVLKKLRRKKYLWDEIRSFFITFTIKTGWHGLFMAILNPPNLQIDTG